MSGSGLEAFLCRIYVDSEARARFKENPRKEGLRAGLTNEECEALLKINLIELEMAARGFARKREFKAAYMRRSGSRLSGTAKSFWRGLRGFFVTDR